MRSHRAHVPAADPPALPARGIVRVLRLVLGCVVAAGLLLLSLWLWNQPAEGAACFESLLGVSALRLALWVRTLAIGSIAAAQFIFICLVTDEICHQTPPLLVVFLKTFTAAVAGGAMLVALGQLWQLQVL